MKKAMILSVIFLVAGLLRSGDHDEFMVLSADDSTVNVSITGTATVYSQAFLTEEAMTCQYWAADTSGDDSVQLVITYQECPDTNLNNFFDGWMDAVTVNSDFTSDSTTANKKLTETAIENYSYGRYKVTGGTDNKTDSAILLRIKHCNYKSDNDRKE